MYSLDSISQELADEILGWADNRMDDASEGGLMEDRTDDLLKLSAAAEDYSLAELTGDLVTLAINCLDEIRSGSDMEADDLLIEECQELEVLLISRTEAA